MTILLLSVYYVTSGPLRKAVKHRFGVCLSVRRPVPWGIYSERFTSGPHRRCQSTSRLCCTRADTPAGIVHDWWKGLIYCTLIVRFMSKRGIAAGAARRYAPRRRQFDSGKNRGGSTFVRGQVCSRHISGGRRRLYCRQPTCL